MRKLFKRVVSFALIPLTRWYLSHERPYRYKDLSLRVFPGVFHPGLFFSTKFLLKYLEQQDLHDKSVLELGCGSGMISIACAKQGARVTASDLSQKAIANTSLNAERNNTRIAIIHSDLFEKIPLQKFDWIVINPPYYAKDAKSEEELAWNCGAEFQYFSKLFFSLKDFIHEKTETIMVLTLGCDIAQIRTTARQHGFQFTAIAEKNVLFDGKDFLFQIRFASSNEF